MKNHYIFILLILSFTMNAQTQNALNFDGMNDYVLIPDDSSLDLIAEDDMTIEFWFKTSSGAGFLPILSKTDLSNNQEGYAVTMYSGIIGVAKIGDEAGGSGLAYAQVNTTSTYNDGMWHHFAAVLPGIDANNYQIYIDNALVSSIIESNNYSGSMSNDKGLYLGTVDLLLLFGSITLDEIRIWDYARTQMEIQDKMNCELVEAESGLVVNYNFNEGIPNENNAGIVTLPDSGLNNNPGSLSNFSLNTSLSNWVDGAPIAMPSFGTETVTTCGDPYTWIDGNTYTTSNNTATYNIVGGGFSGCDSLVTLDLTINSVSDITTTTDGITVSANNTSATYQWLDCDNNFAVISGETDQLFTATVNGNYAVELTEFGCVDTSACAAVISVGVVENDFGNKLFVFPNPTHGSFSVDLGAIYEISQISITDISGKLIASEAIYQSQILNLSIEEPAGIYIVSIQADDKEAIIRLIKE